MTVPAEIVALLAAAVAVFAAVLAVRATALAARTVLAESSSVRLPTCRVLEGHARRDIGTDTRDYVFVIGASNSLPTEWRCDAPTLRVTYRTRANFLGAVDIAAGEPLAVPAGATTTTTLRFTTANVVPRHCRIDAYTLLLVDAGGGRVVVDASLTDVLRDDTDGAGPASWGHD
jgi:hypothetical protein